jgi:septum formation protein
MLEEFGIALEVIPSGCDETTPPGLPPDQAALFVATAKAAEIAARVGPERLVLAADTVVAVSSEVLGKPRDRADAARMLRLLSGRAHRVVTAVVARGAGVEESFVVSTEVLFRPLSTEAIEWYVASGEPDDKAGAYAIQGLAAAFVSEIRGSYANVVGLPLAETVALLERYRLAPWNAE